MAQKPEAAVQACPSCREPVESGDRFCGACGYDLADRTPAVAADRTAAAAAAQEAGDAARPDSPASDGPVAWPAADASGTSAPTHRPGDLPGVDSAGAELPHEPGDHGRAAPVPAAGVQAARAGSGHTVADPRVTDPAELPSASATVCVACRGGRVDGDGYCENCGHAQPRERDHVERELDAVAAVSDRGLRHHRNEDAFSVSVRTLPDGSPAVVAVVCDGVSSAARPDEASAAAAAAADEALASSLPHGTHPQQALHEAIVAAGEAVDALAPEGDSERDTEPRRHRNAPACTIVSSVVAGGLLVVGWVGDSRAYWVPDDRSTPARLTEDDSWAAQMVAAGLMSEEQAYADERAHAITGWLGADAYELEPHTASFKPDRPGVVLVCTDGLWNYAESADEMAAVVPSDASRRPLHAAQVLVGHALDGGGHDNVTVAVVPFAVPPQGGPGAGPGTA